MSHFFTAIHFVVGCCCHIRQQIQDLGVLTAELERAFLPLIPLITDSALVKHIFTSRPSAQRNAYVGVPSKARPHAGSTARPRTAPSGGGLEAPPSLDGACGHLSAAAPAAQNLDVVQAEGHQLPVGVLEADLGDLALVKGALEG